MALVQGHGGATLEALHSRVQQEFSSQATQHAQLRRRTLEAEQAHGACTGDIEEASAAHRARACRTHPRRARRPAPPRRQISAATIRLEADLQREAELVASLRLRKQRLDDDNLARGEGEKRATGQKSDDREQYVEELRKQVSSLHASFRRARGGGEEAISLVGDIQANLRTNEAVFEALAAAGATGGAPAVLERLVGGREPAAATLLDAYTRLAETLRADSSWSTGA